jgi:hypothetical protein
MEDTIVIQITNKKAFKLIEQLEELKLIKVLKGMQQKKETVKLSDKYKQYIGAFTAEDVKHFEEHTKQMREEWPNT